MIWSHSKISKSFHLKPDLRIPIIRNDQPPITNSRELHPPECTPYPVSKNRFIIQACEVTLKNRAGFEISAAGCHSHHTATQSPGVTIIFPEFRC